MSASMFQFAGPRVETYVLQVGTNPGAHKLSGDSGRQVRGTLSARQWRQWKRSQRTAEERALSVSEHAESISSGCAGFFACLSDSHIRLVVRFLCESGLGSVPAKAETLEFVVIGCGGTGLNCKFADSVVDVLATLPEPMQEAVSSYMFMIGVTIESFRGTDADIFMSMCRIIWAGSNSTSALHTDGSGLNGDPDEVRTIDPTAEQQLIAVSEIDTFAMVSTTPACGSNVSNAFIRGNCQKAQTEHDTQHDGLPSACHRVQMLWDHQHGACTKVLMRKTRITAVAVELSRGGDVPTDVLGECGIAYGDDGRPQASLGGHVFKYFGGTHSTSPIDDIWMPTPQHPRPDVALELPEYTREESSDGLRHKGRSALSRLNQCHRERAWAATQNSPIWLISLIINGCNSRGDHPTFTRLWRPADGPIYACHPTPRTQSGQSIMSWLNANYEEQQTQGWTSIWSLVVTICQFLGTHCGMVELLQHEAAAELAVHARKLLSCSTAPSPFPLLPPENAYRKKMGMYACIPVMLFREEQHWAAATADADIEVADESNEEEPARHGKQPMRASERSHVLEDSDSD